MTSSLSSRIEQFVNKNCFLVSKYTNKQQMSEDILQHLTTFLGQYSRPAETEDLATHVWDELLKFDPDQRILRILLPIKSDLAQEIMAHCHQDTFQETFDVDNLIYSDIVDIIIDEINID